MLVLSRKESQIIRIGDDIDVIVVEIKRGTVRLGISAPGLHIDREEIAVAKKASGWYEREAAAWSWDPCLHGA